MKRTKQLLALLLVLVMAFSLTACSDFDVSVLQTVKQMEELESFRADLDVTVGVKMMGFMSMDFSLTGTADVTKNPTVAKGTVGIDLGMLGEAMNADFYYKQVGDKALTSTSTDGGATWSQSETEFPEMKLSDILNVETVQALADFATSFEETGTETVRGSEATVYAGKIKWADVVALSPDPSAFEGANEAIGVDLSKLVFDIPVTLCIDKSSDMLVKFTIDLSQMMQEIMPPILQKAMEEDSSIDAETAELLSSFDFNTLFISVVLYDFDAVSEIVIPAGVFTA